MPRRSWGDDVKGRAKRFFEALLSYINDDLDVPDCLSRQLTVKRQTEKQIVIVTELDVLAKLTAEDSYGNQLDKEEVRQALGYLEELGIYQDNRVQLGTKVWHFTLELWSQYQNKAENLRQFDLVWQAKRPQKSRDLHPISENTQVTTKESIAMDDGLNSLPKQPEPAEGIRQSILNNLEIRGNVKVGNVLQKAPFSRFVEQKIGERLIAENIEFGEVTQIVS